MSLSFPLILSIAALVVRKCTDVRVIIAGAGEGNTLESQLTTRIRIITQTGCGSRPDVTDLAFPSPRPKRPYRPPALTQRTNASVQPQTTSAPDLPLRLSPARHLRLCWLSATILDMNSGFMPSAQLEGPLGLLWPPLRRREVTPCARVFFFLPGPRF